MTSLFTAAPLGSVAVTVTSRLPAVLKACVTWVPLGPLTVWVGLPSPQLIWYVKVVPAGSPKVPRVKVSVWLM